MKAIVLDRNKQYFVEQGLKLKVDLIPKNIGEYIKWNEILLLFNNSEVIVGDPFIKNKKVKLKIIDHVKLKKNIVLKFKRRKNYKKKIGHRQQMTIVEVISIFNEWGDIMAQKKAGGSTRNGRDSKSKRLGIKHFSGEFITSGNIIVRQRGTKFVNGFNVGIAKDYTLFALQNGYIKFRLKNKKYFIDII